MVTKMKVIITNEYPPESGGAGVVAKKIGDEYAQKGYDVIIISPVKVEGHKNIKLKKNRLFPLSYICINKILKSINPDEIIINDMPAIYSCSLFMSKKYIKKSKCFLHGSEPEILFGNNRSLKNKLGLYRYFYEKIINDCRASIFVSEYLKQKFFSYAKKIPLNAKVVNPIIDSRVFFPKKIKSKNRIHNNGTILFSASRIIKEKGYEEMFRLFELISAQKLIYWYIAGDGDYIDEIYKLKERSYYSENIVILGALSPNELANYYNACDIFWLLSELKESFGLVYAEAQACGTFCIAKNGSGVIEALDLNYAYLYEDEDSFIKDFMSIVEKSNLDYKINTRKEFISLI